MLFEDENERGKMDNSKIDPNLVLPSYIGKPDVRFFDIDEPPFEIHGVRRHEGQYTRVPPEIAAKLNTRAKKFNSATAGGRVRFKTDSTYVAIRVHIGDIYRVPMLTLTASAGFDLYEGKCFLGSFNPPYEIQSGGVYEAVISLGERRERNLTLNMPLYSSVMKIWIGIDGKGSVSAPEKYKRVAPIVFYGSSITHGACASRPGMTFSAMLSRAIDTDIINLGFGAGCRGEGVLAEYIAQLDPALLVCAYDHNAPNAEKLKETHEPFYKALREKNKNIQILFVSRPETESTDDGERRRAIIKETYTKAREQGDQRVHYLDGRELLYERDLTHDGLHPNDLGEAKIAEKLLEIITEILKI